MKKHYVAKISPAVWETFLYEYTNSFLPFLSFAKNQEQESNFRQFRALVMRNIYVFCLQQGVPYFKAIPNSIDSRKGIFILVIPVCIIASCTFRFYKIIFFPVALLRKSRNQTQNWKVFQIINVHLFVVSGLNSMQQKKYLIWISRIVAKPQSLETLSFYI